MPQVAKAELHVHLEGTIRPDIAKQLARRNHLQFPWELLDTSQQFYKTHDFLKFLKAYDDIAALIKKPCDYYDITFDYLKQSALSGVIYSEMMYSPDHAEYTSHIPSIEHLFAIQQAIDDAEEQFQILGKIIITGVRHFGVESCENVAMSSIKNHLPCVVGFGLGGDEIHFPPHLFSKAFAIARDGGLKTTIHAGEFADAKSMEIAIETCKINRIGHGVASITSNDTLSMLKDLQIPLEICPSSNVQLGLFPSLEAHPILQFIEHGIDISINSDDPPFMNTCIGDEYQRVQNTFDLSDEKMRSITRMAIKHAFVDIETQHKLLNKI